MKTFLIIILAALSICFSQAQEAKATKPVTYRYEVTSNTEEGLIVIVYELREVHINIPSGNSKSGGKGGVSAKSKEWKTTNKEAFIPHMTITKDMENGRYFTANVTVSGDTKRLYESEVLPIHKVLSLVENTKK